MFPTLSATVLEHSNKAVISGKRAFPQIEFVCGSLSQKQDMPLEQYDLVIVAGVFTLIDRSCLSQAVANADQLLKNGGYIVVSDFYTPYPRANTYHHRPELLTFKQDYTAPFRALNIFTEVYMRASPLSEDTGLLSFDARDPYDVWWMTSVLKKDIKHRYQIPRL
jgi:SAM-dependent methyltransferase